jgi:hypothetical protein
VQRALDKLAASIEGSGAEDIGGRLFGIPNDGLAVTSGPDDGYRGIPRDEATGLGLPPAVIDWLQAPMPLLPQRDHGDECRCAECKVHA